VAQLVEPPTLDVSSGFDLRVVSSSPFLGLGMEATTTTKNKQTKGKEQTTKEQKV